MTTDATVLVVGGGPAGATIAAYLAMAGIDTLVLERARHPRPHVGESLVCSTMRIFREMGLEEALSNAGFVRKYGASWTHWESGRRYDVRFDEVPELGVDHTYHVDRSRFDALLLEHARKKGARVREGEPVERILFDENGRAIGVTLAEGSTLRAQIVVDASGRKALVANQLRLRRNDSELEQFAVHGWFEGVDRGDDERRDYVHIYTLPQERAWIWQIPVDGERTSIGIVTSRRDFVRTAESDAEFFERMVAKNPALAARLQGARLVRGFQREGNYSYTADRVAGDGWLAVGDASRFVDPIFSSGVSIALESARAAAKAIRRAIERDDTRRESFADYEAALGEGVDAWRELVVHYYRNPTLFFDLLGSPATRSHLVSCLQGNVASQASRTVLDTMRAEIDRKLAQVAPAPTKVFPLPKPFAAWLALFYAAWACLLAAGHFWPRAAANWPIAVAMGFGSYFAGSTPMGGGTVGFPVLVLLFHQASSLGRDFSLAIQSIGMTSASIYILSTRQKIAWSMLTPALVAGAASTIANLLWVSDRVPGRLVTLSFASLWAAFGILMLMKTRSIAETEGIAPISASSDRWLGVVVGLIGGVLVGMTGVGIDMLIFVALTVFSRASLRISIPTSVILMAAMSLVGAATKTATGSWNPEVFGAWLAASPVVALGAPFGAIIVALISRRYTLYVVSLLCIGQYVWTCSVTDLKATSLGASILGIVAFNYAAHRLYERYFPHDRRRAEHTAEGRRHWGR